MKTMINFSRIKTRLCFELQAFKKAIRNVLPEMIKVLSNGLSFLWYAFFIGAGLTLGFFFTVLCMQR
ncbi:hypothetical protein G3601_002816 [Salmonella enterica]|uniref:Uncharacterized protein n=1 Tax=Salmonella enterica subsp. enterica serovar Java TaxID=224729 RepID=A0A3Z6QQM7_SALEB|nr:hypothetical protein [Salmonella enterica subsp. enterica serovar Java]EAO0162753.1 hypothetical protein [Salmonella enterica]ECF6068525.1 hypothetical protein [Salmonella enterica subsp. diarizonae]EDQ0178884.1 hypothetical protein [Salmonella enterica subsp. enterica serovar 4,[5],12:b:-]EEE5610861.1 hypothetical protein [Salmonella enterica subsp. enterica serovar Typhimurium]